MADVRWFSIAQCIKACVLCFVISYGHCQTLNTACIEMKKAYTEKGFDENEVPIKAISGADLSICKHQETCCTGGMEEKLTSLSRKEHKADLEESFRLLKSTFESRTRKFDEFFTELLDKAKMDLHEMFVKTYGFLYQQHAYIFTQLFEDLRTYYKGRDKNLMDVMNSFFSKLFQKMFQLLNPDTDFDSEFMGCVLEGMKELKPFEDVPQKLSLHVKRAFIAARTFVQGLAIGRDVISAVMEMAPSKPCVKAIVRMTYCPHCRGLTSTKPCNNYCLNTMKGCLAGHAELNDVWNEYIDALNKLADRLEGPFNIESVVDPIDVKISDAIMNLQENSEKVSVQIFGRCGNPKLSRNKREAGRSQSQTFTFNHLPRNSHARPTTAAGTSLDRLVRDIKDKVKNAKDFWVQLPYTVCNNAVVDPSGEDACWNGQDRARYMPEVQKDGVLHQINNPEVEVDVTKMDSIVGRQREQLLIITNKLLHAYRGEDVGWIDTEIEGLSSGSGSGDDFELPSSGSGAGTSDDEDFDIDERPPYTTGGGRDPGVGRGSGGGGKKKGGHGGKNRPRWQDPEVDVGTGINEGSIRPGTRPREEVGDRGNNNNNNNNNNDRGGNGRGGSGRGGSGRGNNGRGGGGGGGGGGGRRGEDRNNEGRRRPENSGLVLTSSSAILLLALSVQLFLRLPRGLW